MSKITFEESLELIKKLVNNFDKDYKNKDQLNEEDVKNYYINPFLEALGWGIGDDTHKHPNKRDVKFEDTVNVKEGKSKKTKYVDYSMRIGGVPQFFLEAKQPSKNLKEDNTYSFQLRRYGFSAGLPLNILTDFEELSIYDCRIKPNQKDSTKIGQKFYFEFKDYVSNWKTIWDLFSREEVENGSLDYYKEAHIKGTSRVDKEFLSYIENWREKLAWNICLRNREISESDLNYAVQKIIDRIIFLRICESRGIEIDETLKNAVDNEHTYKNLINIFKSADVKYNSGLFHFKKEENIKEEADNITLKLIIDAKILNDIIKSLYDGCPYEFSVFPADILGRVYEQFLGKVISHKENSTKVVVEEKQEVRKAGGVYYTPEYIVKYIVEHTIGELVKGKKIKDIEQVKVIDPACGSGSFLINAYQFLLDKYLELYLEDGAEKYLKGKNQVLFQSDDGSYQLTLEERKKILLNNIYGVDIDAQAVEVTKLSLLLKVLEYEGEEIKQQSLFNERVLPDLYNNIKCGNSLVESDICTGVLELDTKELIRLNPFDWNVEFKDIMDNGGFDCVIGNPPYFNIETLGANSVVTNYFQNKYSDVWMDKSDILFYFIAKGLMLSRKYVSYIVSNAFLMGAKSYKLRNYMLENSSIEKMINFEKYFVFDDADIPTGIFVCNKNKTDTPTKVLNFTEKLYKQEYIVEKLNDQKNYFDVSFNTNCLFVLADDRVQNLNRKVDVGKKKLRNLLKIGSGMQTASNSTFSFKEMPEHLPKEFIKKRITNSNIFRYYIGKEKEYLLYIEHIENFKDLPIEIQEHLNMHKKELKNRAEIKRNSRSLWWKFVFPMHKEYYHLKKIWTSYRSTHNAFVYDDTKEYIGLTNTTVIFDTNENLELKYVLGLLNSSLLNFRYKSIGKQTGAGSFEYFEVGVGELPIVEADSEIQKEIASYVDKMLSLQKHFHASSSNQDKSILEKQIQLLDKEIDKIVYQLYYLTKEEIEIVEESVG